MQIARRVLHNISSLSGDMCKSLRQNLEHNVSCAVWIKRTMGIFICLALCSIIASAQKNGDEKQGITLAELGVTPAQKTQIAAMWTLKRQKQMTAVEHLKILNRLSKDSDVTEAKIKETLEKTRAKRLERQKQIELHEDALLETLPIRAQLHLTLLGVLDNGLPPRIAKRQSEKVKKTPRKVPVTEK